MRLIDADRLLDRCKFYHLPNGDLAVPIIDVQHAPTIEPERKKGKWIAKPDPYEFFDEIPVCSVCGCTTKTRERTPYCPFCGADMRGDTYE